MWKQHMWSHQAKPSAWVYVIYCESVQSARCYYGADCTFSQYIIYTQVVGFAWWKFKKLEIYYFQHKIKCKWHYGFFFLYWKMFQNLQWHCRNVDHLSWNYKTEKIKMYHMIIKCCLEIITTNHCKSLRNYVMDLVQNRTAGIGKKIP